MPTLTVTPNPAPPSTLVSVAGSGFANAKTRLLLDGVGATTNIFRPRKNGTFNVGIRVASTEKTQTLAAQQLGSTWTEEAMSRITVIAASGGGGAPGGGGGYTPPPPPPPPVSPTSIGYGTLDTNTPSGTLAARLSANVAAGLGVGTLQTGWDRNEKTSIGNWSTPDLTAFASQYTTMKNAGLTVILEPGINYPPPHYLNSTYKFNDQFANINSSNELDWIWRASARDRVEAYIRKLAEYVNFSELAGVRISHDYASEFLFPQHTRGGTTNSYWAYSTPAQGGAGRATGTVGGLVRAAVGVPAGWSGWKPGDAIPAGKTMSEWYGWYLDSLVESGNWLASLYRQLGFTGTIWAITPGQGAKPSQVTNAYSSRLTTYSATMAVGAAWHLVADRLDASSDTWGLWCSSAAEGAGADFTQSGDVLLANELETWSSMRRLGYLANKRGLPKAVENPGEFNTNYGLTMLQNLVKQAKAVNATYCIFAHDHNLVDGTGGSYGGTATRAGYQAAISATTPPPPSGASYYISPTGNDTTGNGTIGSPWFSIQKFINLNPAPGTTLYLRGGAYNPATQRGLTARDTYGKLVGTASSPITIRNYPGETPTFNGATGMVIAFWPNETSNTIGCNYVVLDGIRFTNCATFDEAAIVIGGAEPTLRLVKNITIRNCYMSMGATATANDHLIGIIHNPDGVTIEDCTFVGTGAASGGNGVTLYSQPAAINVLVQRCVFDNFDNYVGAIQAWDYAATPVLTLALKHCTFVNNVNAPVDLRFHSTSSVIDCVFTNTTQANSIYDPNNSGTTTLGSNYYGQTITAPGYTLPVGSAAIGGASDGTNAGARQ